MRWPGGRAASWGALAHVFVAIALALPLAVAAAVVGFAIVSPENSMIDRVLVVCLGVLFLAAGVWVALLPPVRQVEVATARTLLDVDLPDVPRPHGWASRRRGARWLAILVLTGLVTGCGVLYLLPLGVGLLAHPFTGADRVRWPGGDLSFHTGSGWDAAWVAVLGLAALALLIALFLGAGRLLALLAGRAVGPSLSEHVALAAEREHDLARANALAREVHDGIGHTLTAMTLQASAARRLMASDPAAADRALAVVEDLGRRAQADVDGVVGALRDPGTPRRALPAEPAEAGGAAQRRDIVPRVRELALGSGSAVELRIPARVELAAGGERAAYRIVQEGLTNAGRHGTGPAVLAIRETAGEVEITVENAFCDNVTRQGGGSGLLGLRERLLLLGGSVAAGPDGPARWVLRARIPR